MLASATELARQIRDGQTTSTEVLHAHLDRINELNESLNAVVLLLESQALAAAQQLDREAAAGHFRGPLHGVPMTVKEQFWLKGQRSTLNSELLKDWVAPEDSLSVSRLREAGAVIMGKTNVPLNLSDYQVHGELFSEGKNPYNPDCTPGGSSGGAAAAVASGMSALELGSDFGGSIRIPANFCGLYGLKPTERTIPTHGMGPVPQGQRGYISHMVVAGPLARTPEDLETAWRILRGSDEDERTVPRIEWHNGGARSLAEYRIAWVDQWPGHPTGQEVRSVIAQFVNRLTERGARPVNASPPSDLHRRSLALYVRLFPQVIAQDVSPSVRDSIKEELSQGWLHGLTGFHEEYDKGFEIGFSNYAETLTMRSALIGDWERYFNSHDLLICPMSYGPAYRRCKIGSSLPGDVGSMPYVDYAWPFVACFNATGHPAINIPLGLGDDGLPIGVQVVGPYWSEPDLIEFAKLAARITPGFVSVPRT